MATPKRRRGELDARGHAPESSRLDARTFADLLIGLAAKLRVASDLSEALRSVARTSAVATDSYQVAVRLLDESGTRLLVGAREGPMMVTKGTRRFEKHEGFQGWVLTTGKADLCNDPEADERFVMGDHMIWTPTAMGGAPIEGDDGVIGVLVMSRQSGVPYDVTDLRLLQALAASIGPYIEKQRLARLALTDPLTLLPNRRAYDEHLAAAAARARRSQKHLCVVMIDLDHFGEVNNRLGFADGDAVLVETARRIRDACRQEDIAFRWGGDEFVLVLAETDEAAATRVAERVRGHIAATPYGTSVGECTLSASFGVARMRPREDLEHLKARAGDGVHRAKKDGRDCVRVGM